ncbi:MAG TPA: ATP phosphoribosyltransferase [Mariniphaga sp.]|nr:ATP phosphoribosyltransferase [Mariniphaga sp.]
MHESDEIVLAFGKGRLFEETLSQFKFYVHEHVNDLLIFHKKQNVTCVAMRHADLPFMLEKGHIDIAVGSSVWFINYINKNLKKAFSFSKNKYRLSIISRNKISLGNIKKVATRFENITRDFFQKKNMDIEIIPMSGNHEVSLLLGFADAIIDVVETGNTINKLNLEEIEVIEILSHEIWLRDDENFLMLANKVASLLIGQ